jgi:hypothetical protein
MLWQFMALLAVHWIADFVLQTHWQASNKSKNDKALLKHVGNYTLVFCIATPLIFGWPTFAMTEFVVVNFVFHLATDWCTSRITSHLFRKQFEAFDLVMPPPITGSFQMRTESRLLMKKDFNPHNFFVVLGLDQLIHQATLAATMMVFLG